MKNTLEQIREEHRSRRERLNALKRAKRLVEMRAFYEEVEERYNPYHVPAGSSRGGQFTTANGTGGINGVVLAVAKGQKGKGYYADTKGENAWDILSRTKATKQEVVDFINGKRQTPQANADENGTVSETTYQNGGLTNGQSGVTIDHDSGLSRAIGADAYDRTCEQINQCSNEDLKDLYADNLNKMNVTYDPKLKQSCQYPGTNDIDLNKTGEVDLAENRTVLHESAHAIDNQLGAKTGNEYSYYSVEWEDGAFRKSLQAEVDAHINSIYDRLKNEYEERMKERDKKLAELAPEYEKHKNDPAWIRQKLIENSNDRFEKIMYESFEDQTILSRYQSAESLIRKPSMPRKERAYIQAANEIAALRKTGVSSDAHQAALISDIFGLATNNKAKDGGGHNNSYAKNPNSLPTEAFAEFSECTVTGHTDLLKRYFPESYANYEKMLKDANSKGE